MSSTKSKSIETLPIKKTLKKKVANTEPIEPVEKTKKVAAVKKDVIKALDVEDVPKVEKTPKKINVKPTLADTQGLNLSVAKVKNIISNLCINKETFSSLRKMRDHRVFADVVVEGVTAKSTTDFTFTLDGLSAETTQYLDSCATGITESRGLLHSRKITKGMTAEETAKYTEAKRVAMASYQKDQRNDHLFKEFEFDLTAFNISYDAAFYSTMENAEAEWKSLKNDALYTFCVNLVNKSKVRFNSESKIFITAFVEYIVKQLVINGTKHCIDDKKKIIQLFHALDKTSPEFTMFPFIASSKTYKKYLSDNAVVDVDDVDAETDVDEEPEVETDEEIVDTDRKLQFRYYVAELCRNVRMELSAADESETISSKFNQTSVSKSFKSLCSNLIIELLQQFGNVLSVEVQTRSVKTVNYSILNALIQNAHIFHNIDSKATVDFIQEKYNIHSAFLQQRQDKRETTPTKTA